MAVIFSVSPEQYPAALFFCILLNAIIIIVFKYLNEARQMKAIRDSL
jgi:hypothetical protein